MVNEIFLLFTITFISQQLPYLCAVLACATQLTSGQDKKVATGPSYPEGTEVVSQNIFKTAFKHLLMNPLAT